MAALLLSAAPACDKSDSSTPAGEEQSIPVNRRELPADLAGQVLAQVGERTITLGDYVSALERMDPLERLRFQTPERRKLLLEEMVNVELLAREAERRGLDKDPETVAHIRQLQREDLLRGLRAEQPSLEKLPAGEVRAYYDAHKQDFSDPERRRVGVLVLHSKLKAQKLLADARAAAPVEWGKLVRTHSVLGAPARGGKNTARPPLELEGDLGLVSAPAMQRGANPRVPEPVRAALFKIAKQGEIYPEVVSHAGKHYIVRLMGISAARTRSPEEADHAIRVRLLRKRLQQAEAELHEKLKKEIPVQINQAVLAQIQPPPAPTAAGVQVPRSAGESPASAQGAAMASAAKVGGAASAKPAVSGKTTP